mgnify:CR=1 FL=1
MIGVAGISAENLVTDFSRETAALREKMMSVSASSFILADSGKFGMVDRARVSVGKNTNILSAKFPEPALTSALETASISFVSAADS